MAFMHHTPTVLASVFIALTWIIVSLRCFIKVHIVRAFGWDDISMVIALVLNTVFAATIYVMASYGFNYHTIDVPPENIFKTLKWWFLAQIFYDWTTAFVKISIAIFLSRIAVKRPHLWAIRITTVVTVTYVFALFFIVVFQCSPPSYLWNKNQTGSCLPTRVVTNGAYAHSAVLAVGDFIFAGVPAWLLWNSLMSRKKKALVGVILGIGSIGGIASLVRFQHIKQLNLSQDFMYDAPPVVYWSYIESSTGIIAGSLVTFRPLLRAMSERVWSTKKTSEGNTPGLQPKPKPKHVGSPDSILLGTFGTTQMGTIVERLESTSYSSRDGVDEYGSQHELQGNEGSITKETTYVVENKGAQK